MATVGLDSTVNALPLVPVIMVMLTSVMNAVMSTVVEMPNMWYIMLTLQVSRYCFLGFLSQRAA